MAIGLANLNKTLSEIAGKPFGVSDLHALLRHSPELRETLRQAATGISITRLQEKQAIKEKRP